MRLEGDKVIWKLKCIPRHGGVEGSCKLWSGGHRFTIQTMRSTFMSNKRCNGSISIFRAVPFCWFLSLLSVTRTNFISECSHLQPSNKAPGA